MTRAQHDRLNRLILQRLPLALPLFATDPTAYAHGITAFSSIYFAFEQVWQDLIDGLDHPEVPCEQSPEAQRRRWLATLRLPGLTRSERLRQDLKYLSRRTGIDPNRQSHAQRRIVKRIRRSLNRKPHTMVAYAWILYMALFSGGRVIRQILLRAGPQFWEGDSDASQDGTGQIEKSQASVLERQGLSFLYFDDGKDGNELKVSFKSRLAEAEACLTEQERQDILDAAVALFDDCIALVRILDYEVGAQRLPWRPPWKVLAVVGLCGAIWIGWKAIEHW